MSSPNPTSVGSPTTQAEAYTSTTDNIKGMDKGNGKETNDEPPPPDIDASPNSASSFWVLTYNASNWARGATTGVILPITPTYEFRINVNTGTGVSVYQPLDVQSSGVIGIYPSMAAAKSSGSSWIYYQLERRRDQDTAAGHTIASRSLRREKGRASVPGAWKRSG